MDPTLISPVKPFLIPSPTPPPLSPSVTYTTADLEHFRLSFDSGLADDFRNDHSPESQEVNDGMRGEFLGLLVTLQSPRKSTA